MVEYNDTDSGHNNHGERGRWGGKGGEKNTKGLGKICHYPQQTKIFCLPGHRDSFRSSPNVASGSEVEGEKCFGKPTSYMSST